MSALTPRDMELLEFSRARYRYDGVRASDVNQRFGITLTRYHQILGALIRRPEAMAYDPRHVRTLLDRQDTLRQVRNGNHLQLGETP